MQILYFFMGNLWFGILAKYYVRVLIKHNWIVTELMTAVTTYVKCSLKSECFSDYFDKKKNHSMIPSFFSNE